MNIDDLEQMAKLIGLLRNRTYARERLNEPVIALSVKTGLDEGNEPVAFYANETESRYLTLTESSWTKIQAELLAQLEAEIESLETQLRALAW